MARICDACERLIEQKNDEYLELHVRVLDSTEDSDQDSKSDCYADFCDGCIANGAAITYVLTRLDWTLEPRPAPAASDPHVPDTGKLTTRDGESS